MDLVHRWKEAKSDPSKLSRFSSDDIKDFITQQRIVFLDALEAHTPYSYDLLKKLDDVYGIHQTENAEIRLRFYRSALKSGKEYAKDAASEYFSRMKGGNAD